MHKLTGGQPVYRYRYCHPRPAMAIKGKVAALAGGVVDAKEDALLRHKTREPFILPTSSMQWVHCQPTACSTGTRRYMISDIFNQYYVNFVKTGNPNGLGLPEWPSTNGKAVAPVLQIDVNTVVKTDAQMEKRYDFIDKLFWKKK